MVVSFKPGDLVWAGICTLRGPGLATWTQPLALVIRVDKKTTDEEGLGMVWYEVETEEGRRYSTRWVMNHYSNAGGK